MEDASEIKSYMLSVMKLYPQQDFDELELAIEAQSYFKIQCFDPDCSVPPRLIDMAREVLASPKAFKVRIMPESYATAIQNLYDLRRGFQACADDESIPEHERRVALVKVGRCEAAIAAVEAI